MADATIPLSGRILKILCLHGHSQNAQIFKEKTGSLRKVVKKYADLVYMTAPHVVQTFGGKEGEDNISDDDKRGWWLSEDDVCRSDEPARCCCQGYQESLESIEKTFQDEGPFDGIFGFSQGASILSLLCGLQEKEEYDGPIRFRFAILVAGLKRNCKSTDHQLYQNKITMPTLHVFGANDRVIPKEMSEELMEYFSQSQSVLHEGGHFVPASGQAKKSYVEFLAKQQVNQFA